MRVLLWLVMVYSGRHDGLEATDRLVPPGWVGNPWGPVATAARKSGQIPAVPDTPEMTQWDQWGRKVLRTGDILFRRGDARVLGGLFPFSRFIANVSGSQFSHTGTVVVEDGEPVVYDSTNPSVRRQPFKVWVLDNTGPFGVKRLKPPYRNRIPQAVEYLKSVFEQQVPFDWELSNDDRGLYCLEMTEKAFRHAGVALSEPVVLADMENISQFPLCVLGITSLSTLKLDQAVFFPGNDRHGIWASPYLETVYSEPVVRSARPPKAKPPALNPPARPSPAASAGTARPAAPQQKAVADRAGTAPRN